MNLSTLSEADQARIRTWQKWMLTLAFICEMFLAADWYAFAAVIPFISKTLNLNPAEAGLAQDVPDDVAKTLVGAGDARGHVNHGLILCSR